MRKCGATHTKQARNCTRRGKRCNSNQFNSGEIPERQLIGTKRCKQAALPTVLFFLHSPPPESCSPPLLCKTHSCSPPPPLLHPIPNFCLHFLHFFRLLRRRAGPEKPPIKVNRYINDDFCATKGFAAAPVPVYCPL